MRVRVHCGSHRDEVRDLVSDLNLNTVCQSAQCPNLAECWHRRTATFMILGDRCSRSCRFCAVKSGTPPPPDAREPARLAEACARMGLDYVVVTSVTRDDLADRGADQFVRTVEAVRERLPEAGIEILTPDFGGDAGLVRRVAASSPTVFNHNLETCRRLTAEIRGGADYGRSLSVLRTAAEVGVVTKSGFMVGLGESDDEVTEMIGDLVAAGVAILTIGQYLPPSPDHWPLDRYPTPEEFTAWGQRARAMGVRAVASQPLVRSSYQAKELAEAARREQNREPKDKRNGDNA